MPNYASLIALVHTDVLTKGNMWVHIPVIMPNMFQLKCPCMSARVPAGPLMRQTHLHIFTSSHLHIFTHLLSLSLFFTSSHLHIFSLSLPLSRALSCPLSLSLPLSLFLLPSCPLALCHGLSPSFSFLSLGRGQCRRGATKWPPFRRNEVRVSKTGVKIAILDPPRQPFRTKRGSNVKNHGKIAILALRRQPFRMKWGSSIKNCGKIAILELPRQPFRTKRGSSVKNWGFFAELGWSSGNLFARNEVRVSKTEVKLRFDISAATLSRETRFECQKLKGFLQVLEIGVCQRVCV